MSNNIRHERPNGTYQKGKSRHPLIVEEQTLVCARVVGCAGRERSPAPKLIL